MTASADTDSDAPTEASTENDDEPWQELAEHRDALEMCVAEDVPFADRARRLLERLEEEGY